MLSKGTAEDYRDHPFVAIGHVKEVLGTVGPRITEIFSVKDYGVACADVPIVNGSIHQLALYLSVLIDNQARLATGFNGYTISVWIDGERFYNQKEIERALSFAHNKAQREYQ